MNARVFIQPWALIAAVCLAGCSDLGAPLRLVPHAELSAPGLDFGTIAVSTSAQRSVTVGNSGTGPLSGVASVSCPDYSIVSGGSAFTVAPGDQHVIVVRYQPSGVGTSLCSLELGPAIPAVPLSGEAALQAPGAAATVSVTQLDFGTLAVGFTTSRLFRINSTGTAPVILNVVTTCSDFTIIAGGGPATLAAGQSLDATVSFTPSVGGHLVCAVATGPGLADVAVSGDGTTISFRTDVAPIMSVRGCFGCHGWNGASDLVNVASSINFPIPYVTPFDLENSVVYGKITSTRFGPSMPPQGGMPTTEKNKIKTWILEGAHDN